MCIDRQDCRVRIKLSGLMLNLAVIAQWMNILMWPAMYSTLNDVFAFNTRTLSMFLTLPIYGILSTRVSRSILLGTSCILWSAVTIGHIFCISYFSFLGMSVACGILMGGVIPITRSLIPYYCPLSVRGEYYGKLELAAGIGGALGAVIGSFLGTMEWHLSFLETWQLPFIVIGGLTLPVGICFLMFIVDPFHDLNFILKLQKQIGEDKFSSEFPDMEMILSRSNKKNKKKDGRTHSTIISTTTASDHVVITSTSHNSEGGGTSESENTSNRDENSPRFIINLKLLCSSVTFRCLILQGVTGAFPWAGLSFLMLWFDKMDIKPPLNLILFASIGLGAALGGVLGGKLGDVMASRVSPAYGRIGVALISVVSGIPLSLILFLTIPQVKESLYLYMVFGFIFGGFISWPPGNNNSNLSDVFPESELLPLALGLQYLCEGVGSSFSPYLVGWLATNVFQASNLKDLDMISDEERSEYLYHFSLAPLWICMVSWSLCALAYLPMFVYYPRESKSLAPTNPPT